MKKTANIAMDDRRVLKDVITDQSVIVEDKYSKYKTQDLNTKSPKIKTESKSVEVSKEGLCGLIGLLGIFIYTNPTMALNWYNFCLPVINLITIPNLIIAISVLLIINKIIDK